MMDLFRKLGRRLASGEIGFRSSGATEPDEAPSVKAKVLRWGRPSHCPNCQRQGYLDRIDITHRVMYQHCPKCGHDWTTTDADIEAANAEQEESQRPPAGPDGP